jgi:uncharacterized Zn finger protein
MRLDDFEQGIDPVILGRGRSYYEDGRVLDLEEIAPGRWSAQVEGSLLYEVSLTSGPDGRLAWTCDCPYDWGPVCKHVAAVLLALTKTAPRKGQKKETRADRVRAALQTLSDQERFDLLLELALEDRQLAHMIELRYGPVKETSKEAQERLVREALRRGRGRYEDFDDDEGALRAAEALAEVLNRAARLRRQGHLAQAVSFYKVLLEEVLAALDEIDDSEGALGDCLYTAVIDMGLLAGELPLEERAALFDYCLAMATSETVLDTDFAWDLVEAALHMGETAAQRQAAFAVLDQMVAREDGSSWTHAHAQERAAGIKLSVIQEQDGDAAAQAFMEAHVHYESMRLALARLHLQNGDTAAARRLCLAWLDKPLPSKQGLRPRFWQILLETAVAEGDRAEQTRLNETLFLESGDFTYYEQMKELFGAEAWPARCAALLERIRRGSYWQVDLGEICLREEMWGALLRYVVAHPQTIDAYHEALAPHLPRELSALYEQLARTTLEHHINRGAYRQVCHFLQRMQALGEEVRAAELAAEFRMTYKKRRALQEELNRVFG